MKILKTLVAGFVLITSLLISGCNNLGGKKETGKDVIKIGAILPLTGDLSSYGTDTKKAVQLAVDTYNKGQNKFKIEVVFEDSKGDSKQAVASFQKLSNIDKVVGVVGPITSPEVLAIAPLANTSKLPIVSPSSTSVDVTNAGDYIFRTINSDIVETEFFSKFIYDSLSKVKVGIIGINASGTSSYANSFKSFYTQLGGAVTGFEMLPENTNDFRNAIQKLLKSGANAIYIAGYSKEIGIIVKQIREVNKTILCLSYQSAEDSRVVELAGQSVDGLIYSSTTIPNSALGKQHDAFMNIFSGQYVTSPGIFAAEIYDGANILIESVVQSKQDPAISFIDILSKTKNHQGASGEITFDRNGDVHKPIAIYKYIGTGKKPLYIIKNEKVEIFE